MKTDSNPPDRFFLASTCQLLFWRVSVCMLMVALAVLLLTACMPPRSYQHVAAGTAVAHPARQKPATSSIQCDQFRRSLAGEAAHPVGVEALTLESAIAIALEGNPDMEVISARLARATAARQQARSAFYPHFGVYTEYSQGDAPSAFLFKTIDQRRLASDTDFNRPGWFENVETGVQGRINLFHGYQDLLGLAMADQDLAIARFQQVGQQQFLAAAVARVYYQTLAAADYIHIAEESAATVAEQLRVMQVRYSAGGALKSDILSLEVRQAQARENIVRSTTRLETTQAALAELMGWRPMQVFQVTAPPARIFELPADTAAGLELALKQRPEMHTARARVAAARMALDRARGEYLPRLDLSGKYYHDDNRMAYSRARENWLVALTLNWDVFNGFATQSRVDQTIAALDEALAAERKAHLAVELDVHTAYLGWREACARLDVAEKSVVAARESLALVKRQYEGGSATITRYLEAELAYNQARIASTAAYYDREIMLADIARAVGGR